MVVSCNYEGHDSLTPVDGIVFIVDTPTEVVDKIALQKPLA